MLAAGWSSPGKRAKPEEPPAGADSDFRSFSRNNETERAECYVLYAGSHRLSISDGLTAESHGF